MVKLHHKLMNNFYLKEFKSDRKIDEDKYKLLPFAFKFFGHKNEGRTKGQFHILRILNFHIIHLLKFRSYVIIKWADIPDENLRSFNKRMYSFLSEYLTLLENCVDPDSGNFFNKNKPIVEKIRVDKYLSKILPDRL